MPDSSPSDRGGGWVVAQTVLMVLFVVLVFLPPYWPHQLSYVGIPIALAGAAGFVWSARSLGKSLTPYPRPRETGELIEKGPYRFVRHPIYVAGLLFFFGVGLLLERCRRRSARLRSHALVAEGRDRGGAPGGAVPRVRGLPEPRPLALGAQWCGYASVVRATWPEPVERVAAYLREAGAEARLEELDVRHGDRRGRRDGRRLHARADRQVDRGRVRRQARRRARPGRPARRPRQDRARRRRGEGEDRAPRRGGGGDGLRAGRRRAVPAAEGRARADRPDPARPTTSSGSEPAPTRTSRPCIPVDLVRLARAQSVDAVQDSTYHSA